MPGDGCRDLPDILACTLVKENFEYCRLTINGEIARRILAKKWIL
jgi:hypothetical protein